LYLVQDHLHVAYFIQHEECGSAWLHHRLDLVDEVLLDACVGSGGCARAAE